MNNRNKLKLTIDFILFLLIIIVFTSNSLASPVAVDMVQKVSVSFINNLHPKGIQKLSLPPIISEVKEIREKDGRILAYIAELKPEGFIIMSADTDLEPIVGYSLKGEFPFDDAPNNVLLQLVNMDMSARFKNLEFRDKDIQNTAKSNNESWDKFILGNQNTLDLRSTESYRSFLITTNWHQNDPYNLYGPFFPEFDKRSPTGCVAVAAAQIFNYWHYPTGINFSVSDAYLSDIFNYTINIPEDASGYELPSFGQINNALSTIQYNGNQNEEALLCYAAGVTFETHYSPYVSGVIPAYNPIANSFHKLGYTSAHSEDWSELCKEKVIENIKTEKPVFAILKKSGSESDSHAIIIDGYDSSLDQFHINVGWGNSEHNIWYDFPTVMMFNVIDEVTYNITPPYILGEDYKKIIKCDANGFYTGYSNGALRLAGTVMQTVYIPGDIVEDQINLYRWDFGDGSNLWESSNNIAISHHYKEGNYNATFSLELKDGTIISDNAQITILSSEQPSFRLDEELKNAYVGVSYSDTLFSLDSENQDTITFTMLDGPEWLTIEKTGTLKGEPTIDDIGVTSVLIKAEDKEGLFSTFSTKIIVENDINTSVEYLPTEFKVFHPYPNPFNVQTTIQYQIQNDSFVEIAIYDLLGRKITEFEERKMKAGMHKVIWNGKDNNGREVVSGIYIYIIKAGNLFKQGKMMLLK